MHIECFGESIEIADYEIDGRKYVDCLIRKQNILLLPEEKIRQAILIYLINYTKITEENYTFKVEYRNLDIAIYHKNKSENFQPACSPILIIEVKRANENLSKHESQILNYLELNSCFDGLLTNCQQTFLYSIKYQFKKRSFNINQLDDYFDKCKPDNDLEYFNSATHGDTESFIFLIHKYGQTCKFEFLCTNYETPINTFLVSQRSEFIFFDFCGISKKKQTKIITILSVSPAIIFRLICDFYKSLLTKIFFIIYSLFATDIRYFYLLEFGKTPNFIYYKKLLFS